MVYRLKPALQRFVTEFEAPLLAGVRVRASGWRSSLDTRAGRPYDYWLAFEAFITSTFEWYDGRSEAQTQQRPHRVPPGARRQEAQAVDDLSGVQHGGALARGLSQLRTLHGPEGDRGSFGEGPVGTRLISTTHGG